MATQTRSRGHLPRPDSAARLLLIRTVAVMALAITTAYLVWRVAASLNLAAWYLAIPLVIFEIHAAIGLGLFTFSLWDVDRRPPRRAINPVPTIAVAIPTYNEGPERLSRRFGREVAAPAAPISGISLPSAAP